jgi:histone-lysine N-methyltransferase SETD7
MHCRWECNRNLIYLPPPSRNEMYIDVPKSYWSIAKYRATLGHKINHSFKYANSRYGMAYHPRYGSIRAVYATRHITRGEEILVNYGFKQGLEVPKWYATLYQTELGKQCYNGTLCS